jgi:hypothetical protein
MIMAGWNGGLSLVLMGLLVGGRMPVLAEPMRVAQTINSRTIRMISRPCYGSEPLVSDQTPGVLRKFNA